MKESKISAWAVEKRKAGNSGWTNLAILDRVGGI